MKKSLKKTAIILAAALAAVILAGVVFVAVTAKRQSYGILLTTKQFHKWSCEYAPGQADDCHMDVKMGTWIDMIRMGYKPCPHCFP